MKKIIILGALVALLVGGGVVGWWLYNNSPAKVFNDALTNAMQTAEVYGEYDIIGDHTEVKTKARFDIENEEYAIDMNMSSRYDDRDIGGVNYEIRMKGFLEGTTESFYMMIEQFSFDNPTFDSMAGSFLSQITGQWVELDEYDEDADADDSDAFSDELFNVLGWIELALPLAYLEGDSLEDGKQSIKDAEAYEIIREHDDEELDNRIQHKFTVLVKRDGIEQINRDIKEDTDDLEETLDTVFNQSNEKEIVVWIDKRDRTITKAEYRAQLSEATSFFYENDLRLGDMRVSVNYRYSDFPSIDVPQDTITEEEFEALLEF